MLSRRAKTKENLLAEYDEEKWLLSAPIQTDGLTLDSVIKELDRRSLGHHFTKSQINICEDGKIKRSSLPTALMKSRRTLLRVISKSIRKSPTDSVVEFGSGLGQNILQLISSYKFDDVQFYSLEISSRARAIQKKISRSFKLNLNLGKFDVFERPHFSSVPLEAVFFSSFVFSLNPITPYTLINRILKFKPKLVIHYEPLYELNQGSNSFEKRVRTYIDYNDYNRNLLGALEVFQQSGHIKILNVSKNVFGLNPEFPASIIMWEPRC